MLNGRLPVDWKMGRVISIFKKGDKRLPSNYRPVNLTIPCKVMESLVRDHLMDHLTSGGQLSDNQHGFRARRSCMTQLLEVLEDWTQMIEDGDPVDALYLDFRKSIWFGIPWTPPGKTEFIWHLWAMGMLLTGSAPFWLIGYTRSRSAQWFYSDFTSFYRWWYSDFPIQNTFMSTVVLVNEVSEVLQRHYPLSAILLTSLSILHNCRLWDQIFFSEVSYPSYMSKVNAHYERIEPRNGVRNPVAVVDRFRMHFDNAHYNRIDPRNGVSHSVSGVNPFIMRIYFAHVSGVVAGVLGNT